MKKYKSRLTTWDYRALSSPIASRIWHQVPISHQSQEPSFIFRTRVRENREIEVEDVLHHRGVLVCVEQRSRCVCAKSLVEKRKADDPWLPYGYSEFRWEVDVHEIVRLEEVTDSHDLNCKKI
jgi:hypothetical protein